MMNDNVTSMIIIFLCCSLLRYVQLEFLYVRPSGADARNVEFKTLRVRENCTAQNNITNKIITIMIFMNTDSS